MNYIVYRWAKPSKRFEPRSHLAMFDPNFIGIKVPEKYQQIVYAGMDPFTWTNISERATHLHRITLTEEEAAECVVAEDNSQGYSETFIRLNRFANAHRYPFRNEVLIPFAVEAELIEVPDPEGYECLYPEVYPRPSALKGNRICSLCREEKPVSSFPPEENRMLTRIYFCYKCIRAIEKERSLAVSNVHGY